MQIPVKQLSDTLDASIPKLDQTRAADLTELSVARSAKFAGLARDRARLAAKLGETDSRVIVLDRSIALHQQVLNGYHAESAASSIDPPAIDARSWALHGNVVDATRAPVEGVTVALYEGNTWNQRAGHACTDARGYFLLRVTDAANLKTPLALHILRGGKTVYVDPNPLTIQPAHVEYREVVLDSKTTGTCEPPVDSEKTPPSPQRPQTPPSPPRTRKTRVK